MSDRLAEIEARLGRLDAMKHRARDRHDADLRDLLAVARVANGLVIVNHAGQTYCDQCRTEVDECRCPIGVLRAALANLEGGATDSDSAARSRSPWEGGSR